MINNMPCHRNLQTLKRSIQKEKYTLREQVNSESDHQCANKNKHEKLVTYNSYTNKNSFPSELPQKEIVTPKLTPKMGNKSCKLSPTLTPPSLHGIASERRNPIQGALVTPNPNSWAKISKKNIHPSRA